LVEALDSLQSGEPPACCYMQLEDTGVHAHDKIICFHSTYLEPTALQSCDEITLACWYFQRTVFPPRQCYSTLASTEIFKVQTLRNNLSEMPQGNPPKKKKQT